MLRDCEQLEPLRHVIDGHRSMLDTYVREALRPVADDLVPRTMQVVCALLDYPTWQSLVDRNLDPDEIVDELCRLVLSCVKRRATKVS